MIGSEGTLGFVAQATYNTVPEWPHKVWHLALRHRCSANDLGSRLVSKNARSSAGMTAKDVNLTCTWPKIMWVVPVLPQKSAFVIFPDVHSACAGAAALRNETHVDAVEMFDRASLR